MSLNNLTLIFNGVTTIIFLINIFFGYKNGFLKTVINMLSGIISIFIAYNFAPVLAKTINLTTFLPPEYLLIAPFINRIIWYVITFLVCLIVIKIIAKITEILNKAPIIGLVNKLAGAVASFAYSFIICALISLVVSLPIFNFREAYEKSLLKPINTVAITIVNTVSSNEYEIDSYTDKAKENFYNWLIKNEMINADEDSNIFDLFNFNNDLEKSENE